MYGTDKQGVFNENDWTEPFSDKTNVYAKSKTLAEQAAWAFIEKDTSGMELSTVLPAMVFGPILEEDFGVSVGVILDMMNGKYPIVPNWDMGIVDVRDVAELHLLALESSQASGNRFIASSETMAIPYISKTLREKIPEYEKRFPKRTAPDLLIKLIGLFSPLMKTVANQLGKTKELDNSKAKNILGWQPRSGEESVIASAESLIEFDLVKPL